MRPARREPPARDQVSLVLVDAATGASRRLPFAALARLLDPGDLVVVNDAATFPGSLSLATAGGEAVELRLIEERPGRRFLAVAFGAGDWRQRTEDRPPPPTLEPGDALLSAGEEVVRVASLDARSPRLLEVRFAGEPWEAIYRLGRPIQYSHLEDEQPLWSVQTAYASRPVAAEMPSAGRPLSHRVVAALRRRGVALARLTHAAGISSTGDAGLDALLPLPERYHIPAETAAAVAATRGRVVAVGTTVVRALESAACRGGGVRPGPGLATLVIGPETRLRVVDALLTGLHEPGASHHRLLQAFAPLPLVESAWAEAAAAGLRGHELGDLALVRASPRRGGVRRPCVPALSAATRPGLP